MTHQRARKAFRPTGRRRLTEGQIRATAGLTGRFDPVSPGKVLSAFKRAAPALRLSRQLVDLIDLLMSYTQKVDWLGRTPIIWPSNKTLQDALGLGRTRVKELLRAAQDAGLISARHHGNGKRYGHRDEGGRIVNASGFDLSPLGERWKEFEAIAAKDKERRVEAKRLQSEISQVRYKTLMLTDFGSERSVAGLNWSAMALQAKELAAEGRSLGEPSDLISILGRLRALHAQLQSQVQSWITEAGPVESDPKGSENRPHYTPTNQLSLSVFSSSYVASGHRMAVENRSDNEGGSILPAEDRKLAVARRSALRGFPATPGLVPQIAPAFRIWVNEAEPEWSDVIDASFHVCAELGIAMHAWKRACFVLGDIEAAVVLAVIAAKSEAGDVLSPGGLLRRMVDLHLEGKLRLDRTLLRLADRAGLLVA
jgi:replication initiation protein RepC